MKNEILDEEINDDDPVENSGELNLGDIIYSVLLAIAGYSFFSESYNYYRFIKNIDDIDILTLIPPESKIIINAIIGISFLLGSVGILIKIKRTYLFSIFIISLATTYCLLKLWYDYPYEYIYETIMNMDFYLILIGMLYLFLKIKKYIIKYDKIFYASILLGIILGKIPYLFGKFTITEMIARGILF